MGRRDVGAEGSFLVEEFIDSITTQLDRVQDALRIKAVNRPLTYALKDLSLELKVFVELDAQGKVRFRTSGANEAGASVVHLGFTTITKPMIEENTVSIASSRGPSLEEAGLDESERRSLERYGVRTIAQLQKLGSTTGISAVSRLSSVPSDRLKAALSLGRPRIDTVGPVPKIPLKPAGVPKQPVGSPRQPVGSPKQAVFSTPPKTFLPPGTRKLEINGRNLVGEVGPPVVKLNQLALSLAEADDDRLVIDIPEQAESGPLELEMPDGSVMSYDLVLEDDTVDDWAPEVRS
jgi:hypothetical protein